MTVITCLPRHVLDVDVQQVCNLASRGTLTRHAPTHARLTYDLDEVEARSLARLKYHQTGHPYWADVSDVADYLGMVKSRVRIGPGPDALRHRTESSAVRAAAHAVTGP